MSAEGINYGSCVSCPKCGQVQQRGYETDSILVCSNCHYEFYVFMEGDFQMVFPAYWVENSDLINRMKAFVVSIGCGHGRITYQPLTDSAKKNTGPVAGQDVIQKIWKITNRGNNAEVKSDGNGGLKVYEVKKNIAKD